MNPPPYTAAFHEADRGFESLSLFGDLLIIALDFGTTYSGIAYAFSNDPEKVFIVDSFPGGDRIVPKAPTTIRYEPGSKTSFKWGYELDGKPDRKSDQKLERIKLLFDPNQPRPYSISGNLQVEMEKLPKDVTEIASDYMRAVFQHAMTEIEGNALDPEFLSVFDKQYILTVPAIWSDQAKAMTLKAAEMAGISPVNDAILVCDAGGGTVDLIAYEILSLTPFEVKALTKPSGGMAGSSMINKMLEDEIKKAVGDEAYTELRKTIGYHNALREFDVAVKVTFEGKNDKDKYISFPMASLKDNPQYGIVKNAMRLSGATVFRLFDPITREVDRLVTEQVNNVKIERLQATPSNPNGVKAIFLVGGFGSSGYLREVIKKSNPGIMVVQPKEAWSSIVRGAVMSKLPTNAAPVVVSSKAWKHYGVLMSLYYNAKRDKGFPTYVDPWEEITCCDTIDWFIKMDDELVRGKKTKHKFYQNFAGHSPRDKDLIITVELFECTTTHAPDHPGENVQLNCKLVTDLRKVPKCLFEKKTRPSDGAPYCELWYSLQIENNQSGLMRFSLEIDGKEYSAVEAKY